MDGVKMAIKNTHTFTREERIQQLKDACDSIKENAADFIGNEEFHRNLTVSVVMNCREFPFLRLERESLPHIVVKKIIDR